MTLHDLEQFGNAGYAVLPGFLSEEEVKELHDEACRFFLEGKYRSAGTGRGEDQTIRPNLRRDQTLWWDFYQLTPPQKKLAEKLENFRLEINRNFCLGAFELEGHFSHYGPGDFYHRHRDRFQSDDRRILSTVLYLNPEWHVGDGGELRLYRWDQTNLDIQPQGGTLVFFASDAIEHEVLPSHRNRFSFAGWFKKSGEKKYV